MNEIEKMYSNAGIKPIVRDDAVGRGYYIEHQAIEEYPPFTAEKQIELIKWLARKDYGDYTSSLLINITDNLVYFSAGAKSNYCAIEVLYDSNKCTDFENALAGLINDLWQDLTEEERKQIKEILK